MQEQFHLELKEKPWVEALRNRFIVLTEKPVTKDRIIAMKLLLGEYTDLIIDLLNHDGPEKFFRKNRNILYDDIILMFENPKAELIEFESPISLYEQVVARHNVTQDQAIWKTVEMFRQRYEKGFDPIKLEKLKRRKEKNKPPSGTEPFLRKEQFRNINGKVYGTERSVLSALSIMGLGSIKSIIELKRSNYVGLAIFFENDSFRMLMDNGEYVYSLEDMRTKVVEINNLINSGLAPDKRPTGKRGLFLDSDGNTWASLTLTHTMLGFVIDSSTDSGKERIRIIKETKSKTVCKSIQKNESDNVYRLDVTKSILDKAGLLKDQRTLKTSFR